MSAAGRVRADAGEETMPERLTEELWEQLEGQGQHPRRSHFILFRLLAVLLILEVVALVLSPPALRLWLVLAGLMLGAIAIIITLIQTRRNLGKALLASGWPVGGGEDCALLSPQVSGPAGDESPIPDEGALCFRFQPDQLLPLLVALRQREPDSALMEQAEGRFRVEQDGRVLLDRPRFLVLDFLRQANEWQTEGGREEFGYRRMGEEDDGTPVFHFLSASDGWHFSAPWQLAEAQRPIGAAELRAALGGLRQDLRAMSRLRPAKSNTEEGR